MSHAHSNENPQPRSPEAVAFDSADLLANALIGIAEEKFEDTGLVERRTNNFPNESASGFARQCVIPFREAERSGEIVVTKFKYLDEDNREHLFYSISGNRPPRLRSRNEDAPFEVGINTINGALVHFFGDQVKTDDVSRGAEIGSPQEWLYLDLAQLIHKQAQEG